MLSSSLDIVYSLYNCEYHRYFLIQAAWSSRGAHSARFIFKEIGLPDPQGHKIHEESISLCPELWSGRCLSESLLNLYENNNIFFSTLLIILRRFTHKAENKEKRQGTPVAGNFNHAA
jgi:hypothetical protein